MQTSEHSQVKISIITVVYNAVDTIERTLQSVLVQDYANVEYVIIDGGSTDGTVEILNRYRNSFGYFVSERDDGLYEAMNKGVLASTGDWVGVVNAGDVFSSNDVLSRIFGIAKNYEGVDVIYGDAVAVQGRRRFESIAPNEVSGLSRGPVYRHGASFVRRTTHQRFLFNLSLRNVLGFALDYEQIHRMFKAGCVFCKVPVTVVDYARRGASTISPFKPGYYNYLITHDMHCSTAMRVWLIWLACWQKLVSILKDRGGKKR